MDSRRGNARTNGSALVSDTPKKKLTKKRVKKMLAKAIGKETAGMAKLLDEIAAKVGVTPTPVMARKGGDETPLAKTNGRTAGELVKSAVLPADDAAVASLAAHVRDLRTETHALLTKRDSGTDLNSEEKVRLTTIDMDLSKAKIAYQAATGRPASDIYVEAT